MTSCFSSNALKTPQQPHSQQSHMSTSTEPPAQSVFDIILAQSVFDIILAQSVFDIILAVRQQLATSSLKSGIPVECTLTLDLSHVICRDHFPSDSKFIQIFISGTCKFM